MGGTAQKRLVRKRDLERALSEIEDHPLPNAYLEQYTTPSKVAAEILYLTAYVYDDIIDKTVMDLGCGTGRLAIGAALLGAREVFGVDVDWVAVRVAQKNAEIMSVKEKTHWIVADIGVVKGTFDTVLQNPPFGVLIKRFIEGHGGRVTNIFPLKMEIPRMFKFHTKRKRSIQVDLYRIEGKSS